MSLNALVAACNQSSNRNPVMHLQEGAVADAMERLREKGLAHRVDRGDSRVVKYRHVLYEAMNWGRPVIAVMCVLMLRGPQTVGEIRTRTNRLYDFTSLDEVELTLNSLMTGDSPLITRLARLSGQKEVRYAQLLSGEVSFTELEPEAQPEIEREVDRIGKLEKEVEDLKRQFQEFRKQFE
jgi:uncharacterized protein YceH (UPF0502 family)